MAYTCFPSFEDVIDTIPTPTKESDQPTIDPGKDIDAEKPEINNDQNVDIVIDLDKNNTRNEAVREMWIREHDLINSSLRKIDLVLKQNRNIPGQEGFVQFIANSLTAIPNIIAHVGNLFTSTLIWGWYDYKRGEMTAYSDSNRATMTRIYTTDYYLFKDEEVDTPQGMKGKYIDAFNSLVTFFRVLNMNKRVKLIHDTIEAILEDIRKSNVSFNAHVKDFTREHNDSNIAKAFKETSKFFTVVREDGGVFGKLFTNMSEYEKVVKSVIDNDSEMRSVAGIHDRMKSIEQLINQIIEEKEKLKKNQIDDLVKIVRTIGELFDMYATCLNDASRVDHNICLVTKTLRSVAGY